MSTNKGRGRSRKGDPIRRLTDAARRGIACLLCFSIVITCLPGSVILAGAEADDGTKEEKEIEICILTLDSLCEAIEDAVSNGISLNEDEFEFSGSSADSYEKLFDTTDGLLCEIYPDLDEECDSLTLRTFVRLKKSGIAKDIENEEETDNGAKEEPDSGENDVDDDLISGYNVTGDEEVIFLLINNTEDKVNARIYVTAPDEVYETKKITVPGNRNSTHIPQYTVESMNDVKYFVIDEKEENVKIAALRVESGSDAYETFIDFEDTGETERTEEIEESEEILPEESASSGDSINAVAESSSNVSASAFNEDCIPMKGKLYDPVSADGMKAVAFVTALKDLGFEKSVRSYSLIYEGTDYTITLEYDSDADIPEDAEVSGEEYDPDSEIFKKRFEEAKVLYGWEDGAEPSVRLFDVTLWSDEKEIEPESPVQITITFHDEEYEDTIACLSSDDIRYEDGDDDTDNEGNERDSESTIEDQPFTITHFGAYGTETIKSETSYDESGRSVTFTLESLSDIMVLAYSSVTVVLNLGNIDSDSGRNLHYSPANRNTGYSGPADNYPNAKPLRYTVTIPADNTNSSVNINLPCDDDLGTVDQAKTFTVYTGRNGSVSVDLYGEWGYDYRLVGWFDIATGRYYDVSNGPVVSDDLTNGNHVFYADWIAADYDQGTPTVENANLVDTIDTSSFVTVKLYDFNELFNMYSTMLTQSGTASESWSINSGGTGYFYREPFLKSSYDASTAVTGANALTLFDDSAVMTSAGSLGRVNNRGGINSYQNQLTHASTWGIQNPSATVLQQIFNDDNASNMYGVYYVGEANHLFQYGTEEKEGKNSDTQKYVGYYYYESDLNSAVYNQTDKRFYVYDQPQYMWATDVQTRYTGFLPFNRYQLDTSTALADSHVYYSQNGQTNYWFGMNMEVNFYLPGAVGSNSGQNKDENGNDMVFNFSGDDDIMVFVDDTLVLDMAGIHDASYGSINFETGDVNVLLNGVQQADFCGNISNVKAGTHTLSVYYMERGAGASNLGISFNVVPLWEYETGPLQTIFAKKEWYDINGDQITEDGTEDCPDVKFGLFEAAEEGTYTVSNDGKTVTMNDGSGAVYKLDDDGYSRDADNLTDALLVRDKATGGQTFYVRVNVHELSYEDEGESYIDPETGKTVNSYGWYWSWECLDPEGDYIVLELSVISPYTSATDVTEYEDGFYYWTIIGENEIEKMLASAGGTEFEVVGEVILTDAAQHVGEPASTQGYIVVVNNNRIETEEAAFSQSAEIEAKEDEGRTVYSGIYGALGGNTVTNLNGNAIWYVETTGEEIVDDVDGKTLHLFRLFMYAEDGVTKYYLSEPTNKGSLELTTSRESAAEFYDDAMGELRIHLPNDTSGDYRVYITGGVVLVGSTELHEDDGHNVKIYSWNEGVGSGYIFTLNNTVNPDLTIEKRDADDTEENPAWLEGAEFILSSTAGGITYYYRYELSDDAGNDEGSMKHLSWVTDSEEATHVTTGEDGKAVFRYLEDGTYTLEEISPEGYIPIGMITFVIENGELVEGSIKVDGETNGLVSGKNAVGGDGSSATQMVITVKNVKGTSLPNAGGPGTFAFELTGVLTISGSVLMYLILRRKKEVKADI